MNFDLQLVNRRALVTAGTMGVGAAVVQVLGAAGAQIVAAARKAPSSLTDGVRFVAADLSTAEGAAALADSVLRQFVVSTSWLMCLAAPVRRVAGTWHSTTRNGLRNST